MLVVSLAVERCLGKPQRYLPKKRPERRRHRKSGEILYERLGGLKPIAMVVDDFIDRLLSNEILNANPRISEARKNSPAPYLKVQVSNLVCMVTGGPCKYTGKGMKEAHTHLSITEKEWQVMMVDFSNTLEKFKVPAKEQGELVAIVESTKKDIVAAESKREEKMKQEQKK